MRPLPVALAASAAVCAAVPAMAVTFDFSFTNALYGGGLVQGTVSDPVDNATGPGNVAITSNGGGFGIGSYDGNASNSFTGSRPRAWCSAVAEPFRAITPRR